MSLFLFDTAGNKELLQLVEEQSKQTKPPLSCDAVIFAEKDEDHSEDDGDYWGFPPPNVDISDIIRETLSATEKPKTKKEAERELVADMLKQAIKCARPCPERKSQSEIELSPMDINPITGKPDCKLAEIDVDKEMENSIIVAGFEKLKELPSVTERKQRQLNRINRSKSKGPGWFNLPATEVTEEVENDLKILQMRSVLDPKHFYKKNDLKVLPKYFQIGTVQHSALDHYSERASRKNKKKSLVEELLADADVQKYTKRKYNEVVARNDKYAHRKAMKKMKKLKKNK